MTSEDTASRKRKAKLERHALKQASREGFIGQLDVQTDAGAASAGWVHNGLKHGWYIPNANTYPGDQRLFEGDLSTLIREHVVPGHVPAAPLLDESRTVVTLGSCFARELRMFLSASGVKAERFWIPSGLNNTFAILDFFSWCVSGQETGRGYRYARGADGTISDWTAPAERQAYLDAFSRAGAFVFTIGLAEVWQDRESGAVFWRGVPKEIFDAGRHVFRLTTVEENARNLQEIVTLIRQMNAEAPIVLTLSPVPLLATFREISCLTADCVSKSVLRVAIDQVMTERIQGLYYWPSFEIVKWVGATLPWSAYGEGGSARDVNRAVVAAIIDTFVEAYYTPEAQRAMRDRRAAEPAVLPPVDADE
jgi:hypothetical protein